MCCIEFLYGNGRLVDLKLVECGVEEAMEERAEWILFNGLALEVKMGEGVIEFRRDKVLWQYRYKSVDKEYFMSFSKKGKG